MRGDNMTSFEKIFNIFLTETKHTELAKLSEADLVYVLEHFLETSALVEFKNCRKDLSKYTKTKFIKLINGIPDIEGEVPEEDIPNGDVDKATEFNLNSNSRSDDEWNEDEWFNQNEGITMPDDNIDEDMMVNPDDSFENEWNEDESFGANFIITYKIDEIGYFEEDLSYEECYIIALAMVLHKLQGNINREEYFRRTISDRDFKLTDGDKIIESLLTLEKSISKKLKKYKTSYSYNNIIELRDL